VGQQVREAIGGCGEAPVAGALVRECLNGTCQRGACVTINPDCVPNVGKTCSNNAVHAVDSCNAIGAMLEACDPGVCAAGVCIPPVIPDTDGGVPGTNDDAGTATPDGGIDPDDAGLDDEDSGAALDAGGPEAGEPSATD
jgi:hypothetical protein